MITSFRCLLWALGALLAIGSRTSARVRAQLGRDFVFVVATRDGVARSFVFEDRRVTSHAGAADGARCTVRFRTSRLGAAILLAPDTVSRIVDGLGAGDVECDGQAAYVLWFYELAIGLNPFKRRPRDAWPGGYSVHDPGSKAADRITREPPVCALDPQWAAAHAQRDKLMLWQVGRGGEPTGVCTRHRIVVEPPPEPAAPARAADAAPGLAEPTA